LERTLDARQMEEEEAENQKAVTNPSDEGKSAGDQKGEDKIKTEGEGEEDGKEAEAGQKRRSQRLSKQEPKYKRTKRKHEEVENTPTEDTTNAKKFDYDKWKRLEQFLAAGGLRILGRWLQEASEEVYVVRKARKEPELDVKPSPTRALALPLLKFLERIPFDKTLVLESKINKQIRNTDKQINEILSKKEKKQHHPDDLRGWTTDSSKSGTEGLKAMKEAINDLKKTWQDHMKQKREAIDDPFEVLRETLKERLEGVSEFQAGSGPRPEWLVTPEESKKTPKKTRAELAAKERLSEKEYRKKHNHEELLREAEKTHRENMALLRKKAMLRKKVMMFANMPTGDVKRDPNARRVKWKDGMRSKDYRNRKTLEEVFLFDKTTPANKEMSEFSSLEGERETSPVIATVLPVPPELAENPEASSGAPDNMLTDDSASM